ncbi:cholesterol 25-hydroxylase-like protein 2 [Pundamilia nyererei]|uniref:Cholesterol 25-hydroxylase-like protein 2 n=2 Tax=Pundamilia nyererei TaxID=303518 RepID=A0A9Y3VAA6_9CICH|nr:PREDICTED: cholesterol 25-hydroxylase-like protein 2 [Pundamilia nyererei]
MMSVGGLLRTETLSWMSYVDNVTGDYSQDLVLQPIWDYLRQNYHDLLRSPLFPVVLSVTTYFLLVALYTVLDLLAPTWPCINRYRLHPDRPITWPNIWPTLGVTIYNHLLYIFPAAVAQWLWRPPTPLPPEAPTLFSFFLGILGCMVVFDFQYYLWHLLHHRVAWLYRTFHAIHHQYNQPFSLVTQYLSGWELFSVGFWATVDPILLQCHCLTAWSFMVFNVYVSTEDHCGYDFPWATHNLVPFGLWGGAPKHDTHHQRPGTNFAPFFSHWDWLGGTHTVPTASSHSAMGEPEEMKGRKD